MAYAAADAGLELPPLPEATQKELKVKVPFAGTRNPLDVTAQLVNDPTLMQPMFEALLDDGGYQAAICFMAGVGLNDVMVDRLMPSLENIAKNDNARVMVLSIIASPAP